MPNPQTIVLLPIDNQWNIAYEQTSPHVSAQGNTYEGNTQIQGPYARIYAQLHNPANMPFIGGARLWATHNFGRGLRFSGGYTVNITYSYFSETQPPTDLAQGVLLGTSHDSFSSNNAVSDEIISPADFRKEMTASGEGSAAGSSDVINAVEIGFVNFPNTAAPQTYYGMAEIVIKRIEFVFEDFIGVEAGDPFDPPPAPQCDVILRAVQILNDPDNPSLGVLSGGGWHNQGSVTTLTAVPNPGYEFVRWALSCDNILSYDPVFEYTVPNKSEQIVYAVFREAVPPLHEVSVEVVGSGNVNGAGAYPQGAQVELSASATGTSRFQYFRNAATGEEFTDNPHSFAMPGHDVHFEAHFFEGIPANITGEREMMLTEGYEATRSNYFLVTGTSQHPYGISVSFDSMGTKQMQLKWSQGSPYIEIAAGLKRGTYKAAITAANEFNYNPYVLEFTLYVVPPPGSEQEPEDDEVLGMVEVRRGIVPIRIPQVLSGHEAYRHIPLIELHEKRARKSSGLFYAYELMGRNSGCLRLSRLTGLGKLLIHYDRVIVLPRRMTSEINLPNNMLALIQAHLALALAKKFGTPKIAVLEEKAAQCSTWFARQQSTIDRNTFLDPNASYARFSGRAGVPFRGW